MFCPECDEMTEMGKCRRKDCSNYSEPSPTETPLVPKSKEIPPEIDSGQPLGILRFYGYKTNGKEIVRRRRLLQLYVDELLTEPSASNRGYVSLLGPPKSKERVHRIIEIMEGLNVFAWGDPRIREVDAEFLRNHHDEEESL